MESQPIDISALLGDAMLQTGRWDAARARLTLRFECTRSNADGTELTDRTVEVCLDGIVALAASYDTPKPDDRPAQFEPPEDVRIGSLAPWVLPEIEAEWVSTGSTIDEETVALAARTDWFHGSLDAARDARVRLSVHLTRGEPPVPTLLWVAGAGLSFHAADGPLSLDDWATQHRAWWAAWEKEWHGEQDDEATHDGLVLIETERPPGPRYEPPDEPAFEIDPTDCPEELLEPLRDWFEALLARDWRRRAVAERNPDMTLEEQTERLRRSCLSDLFGRWGYARAVDGWWIEGRRAYVGIRGIEHTMPMPDLAAEDTESVWDLALRQREGRWYVASYSQGWPHHGSAVSLPPEAKPWLARWASGARGA